jgi:hypothetical protein
MDGGKKDFATKGPQFAWLKQNPDKATAGIIREPAGFVSAHLPKLMRS